ncbi:MAG: NUDIX hydrolase [Lysobacterales bacterium CG17_big_fil_post_rev_8_21_14_2_50_64_11]|nr:MAG: NUDIX hydrolase [Xanthomonadales bacterium CG17_big_fil_post_rev_8_21_14_2_50_64_11]PIX60064.1 MAG: NUDIX hydrolase [Xanthomonadales bacterium CG_4_10_14_3_um_filter_64_11]
MNPSDTEHEAIFAPDLTVATVVVRDGRLLMIEEMVRGEAVINQPAGHLEANETLQQAAIRETLEESGWDVELIDFIGCYQWTSPSDGRSFVRFAFSGRASGHHPERALDFGIIRALWQTPQEISASSARHRSPLVLAVVDDFLAGKRLPLAAVRWLP